MYFASAFIYFKYKDVSDIKLAIQVHVSSNLLYFHYFLYFHFLKKITCILQNIKKWLIRIPPLQKRCGLHVCINSMMAG